MTKLCYGDLVEHENSDVDVMLDSTTDFRVGDLVVYSQLKVIGLIFGQRGDRYEVFWLDLQETRQHPQEELNDMTGWQEPLSRVSNQTTKINQNK